MRACALVARKTVIRPLCRATWTLRPERTGERELRGSPGQCGSQKGSQLIVADVDCLTERQSHRALAAVEMRMTDHEAAGPDIHHGPKLPSVTHPYRLGSLIGLIGATVFVLVNRGALPGVWSTVALVTYVAALAFYVWAVWLRPASALPAGETPHPRAGLVYLASVAGMLLVFFLGRLALVQADREALMPALVALGVGVHFVPCAAPFRAPVFRTLGWLLAGIGLVGLVVGWLGTGAAAASAAAVTAGVSMLVVMGHGAVQATERSQ